MAGNKVPYESPPYTQGPAIADRDALLAWLGQQKRRVKVPVVVRRDRWAFSGRDATIGELVVHITDLKLGVPLSERCRQRAGDADTCHVWLEGLWRGEHQGVLEFDVVHVGDKIDDPATATHALGEA